MDLGLCDGRDYLPAKRICIATPLRHPPSLGSWIRYHAQMGVERMYLYFDEPEDPAKAIAGEHREVEVLDNINREVEPRLREMGIWSRGRFGAWKYEVSNQDHSLMQGVEAVDSALSRQEEETYLYPERINEGVHRQRRFDVPAGWTE